MPQLVLCSPSPFPCLILVLGCLSSLFTHSFTYCDFLQLTRVYSRRATAGLSLPEILTGLNLQVSASPCSPGSLNIPSLDSSPSSYCLFSPPLRAVLPQISFVCPTFYPRSSWGGLLHCFPVQSLSCVWLIATPRTAPCQASLSITNPCSLLKLMSIEWVIWVKFRGWPT